MADPLVTLRDVRVTFSSGLGLRRGTAVEAVAGVSLEVMRGEVLALVGQSGSGKTTTIRAMAHLVPITSGAISLEDIDVGGLRGGRLRDFRRRVQVVFQDPYDALNPRQTVRAAMTEVLEVHGVGSREERERSVVASLEACGLAPASDFLDRYPHELSGGQRQRVCIAAAAVLRPEVLIADEPLSMLDVSVRAGIMRLLTDLRQQRNMTLVLVTHDLSLAWALADRVAVMYLGRVVEVGNARDVIRSPAHPYTEALVSAVPIPDPTAPPVSVHLRTTPPPDPVGSSSCPFQPRCLYAKPPCAQEQPTLRQIDSSHLAACIRTEEIRDALRDAAQTHLSSSLETAQTAD